MGLGRYVARRAVDPDAPPAMPRIAANKQTDIKDNRMRLAASEVPVPTAPNGGIRLSGSKTVFVQLAAGFNLVSIPLRTSSQVLADLFPNLPAGSEAWTWNAGNQEFQKGFQQELPFGHACIIYVPYPSLAVIFGDPNASSSIPFDMQTGWNLVGVPYEGSLDLSNQRVLINSVDTAFPDAVNAGSIGKVFTMDGETAVEVAATGKLSEFKGYWVYSAGEFLLQLRPTLLSGGEGAIGTDLLGWGLKSFASGMIGEVGSYGMSKLLSTFLPDPNAEVLAKLQEISNQLNKIDAQQQRMAVQLSNLSSQLSLSTEDVKNTIGDSVYVGPVRSFLDCHYDALTPGNSLNWFKQQTASAAAASQVSGSSKTLFAENLLGSWDVPKLFSNINNAIMGSGAADGVLDTFANKIILTSRPATLLDSYRAMETYFASLITMQLKCGELIGEAYNQLSTDPGTHGRYPSDSAKTWHQQVFQPAIAAEYQKFREVAERVAVSKLDITGINPPVRVPSEVQVMLGYVDFMLMDAMQEPEGMRLRVVVNPDVTSPLKTHLVVNNKPVPDLLLADPSVPSVQWRTVAGFQTYDSWSLVNSQRKVRFTNSWKMVRLIIPGYSTPGTAFSAIPAFNPEPEPTVQMVVSGLQKYDDAYNVVSAQGQGKVFGSIMVAARVNASLMLDPCSKAGDVTTEYTGSAQLSWSNCHALTVSTNVGQIEARADIPFTYVGATEQTSTFQADAAYTRGGPGYYIFELWDGTARLNLDGGPDATASKTFSYVTWKPGHTYVFKYGVSQSESNMAGGLFIQTKYTLTYLDTLMTPQ
jgi:hypothetical protein